jgi:hypothetical protein
MTGLMSGDYLAIAGLLAAFVAVPGSIGIYLLRGVREDNAGFRAEVRETLTMIETRLCEVEQNKVSHTEWVRVTVSANSRMNRISEQLAELGGKMDANFGIPPGLNRIAAALEKHAEAES